MAERTTPFRTIKRETPDLADELMEAVEFGRKNPIALALAALTIGIAAGMLISRRMSSSAETESFDELRGET